MAQLTELYGRIGLYHSGISYNFILKIVHSNSFSRMQLHHLTHYQHSMSDNIHSTNTISYKYRHIDIQNQATPQGAPIYLVVCSLPYRESNSHQGSNPYRRVSLSQRVQLSNPSWGTCRCGQGYPEQVKI